MAKKYLDYDGLAHLITKIKALVAGKADSSHTHSAATTSAAGFMSTSDKSKLDGIATGANAYSLPTASSSTLGGVKTTSTVTSTSGLTACPIISGVPYYKDTNSTYSLSSFGVTATAAELNILDGVTATATELNYVDGVTSNIQTQLNGKAASSHNHAASNITSGTLSSDRLPTVPISKGGTGATSASAALTALGAAASGHNHDGSYLKLTGGSLEGQLELKPYDNGSSRLFKNHSATADYGTVLQDTDKDGNAIKITLQASDGSFYFVDKDGNIYRVYGDHYPATKVGTLTSDISIKKADVAYESTFGSGTNNALMRVTNTAGDDSNRRTLALFDSTYRPDVEYALRLYDVVNGVESSYDIYGEHNITKGTADLTAGVSELPDGAIYFVYE